MFIKTIFKKWKKVKRIGNYVSKYNHGVCHVIYILFGSSLGKVQLCQVLSVKVHVTEFRKRAGPKRPIVNRVKGSSDD